jgi:hypothetical protein
MADELNSDGQQGTIRMKEERDSCPLPNSLQGQAPAAGMTEEGGCPITVILTHSAKLRARSTEGSG